MIVSLVFFFQEKINTPALDNFGSLLCDLKRNQNLNRQQYFVCLFCFFLVCIKNYFIDYYYWKSASIANIDRTLTAHLVLNATFHVNNIYTVFCVFMLFCFLLSSGP
jgi:hypothetical protein